MLIELETLADRAALLPGGSRALFVVAFWRSSDPVAIGFRAQCDRIVWPGCYRAVAVDLDVAPEIEAWFEPPAPPMLAVITDGAILGIEHDSSGDACRRLARCGSRQYSLMKTMSL